MLYELIIKPGSKNQRKNMTLSFETEKSMAVCQDEPSINESRNMSTNEEESIIGYFIIYSDSEEAKSLGEAIDLTSDATANSMPVIRLMSLKAPCQKQYPRALSQKMRITEIIPTKEKSSSDASGLASLNGSAVAETEAPVINPQSNSLNINEDYMQVQSQDTNNQMNLSNDARNPASPEVSCLSFANVRAEQERARGGMKMMGMDEEAVAHQKEKPVLVVKPQRGSTQQVTNRNLIFEDQLKTLSEKMLEILEEKPDPGQDFSELIPPTDIKVTLLPHQKYSMVWLKWREHTFPHGSILADDMGLGKTLAILAYLKRVKDEKKKRLKTLVIVPASLLLQWQGEIKNKFEKDAFKIHVYHDTNRRKNSYNMEDNDLVFTTYKIVAIECEIITDENGNEIIPDSPLSNIKWSRIILDEAHLIKNPKNKCSKAICALKAKYRIAITGTPIQNSLTDLYSLVKFLHLEPLNDFTLWKYTFEKDKNPEKKQTANAIQRSKRTDSWVTFLSDYLMLRRTKQDKFKGTERPIVDLPEKKFEIIKFALGPKEKVIYDEIFKEGQNKVRDFLKNKKNRLLGKKADAGAATTSEIFVYLLRLRRACCHTSLLAECLDRDELRNQNMESYGLETATNNASEDGFFRRWLDKIKSDDDLTTCLNENFRSSKLTKLIEMVEHHLEEDPDDKMIIVSQWTGVLAIVAKRLRSLQIEYCEIKGDVKLYDRNQIQIQFNDSDNKSLRVMLLSLTAGSIGLNLVGANRMFLLDIHWNPALEQQCCDRIYRVGQKKPVTIYKFLCEQTIEERFQSIQETKVELANKVYGQSGTGPADAELTDQNFEILFTAFAQTPPLILIPIIF